MHAGWSRRTSPDSRVRASSTSQSSRWLSLSRTELSMGLYARDRLRSSSERAASCAVGSSTAVAGWAYPASLAPKNAGGINSPTAGASRAHTTAPIGGLRVMSFDREQLRLPLSSAAKRSRFCHHVDPRAEPGVCPRCLRLRSADGLKLSTRCTRPCASTAHSARTNRPAFRRSALLWRTSRSIPITVEVEHPPPLGSRFVRFLIRSNTMVGLPSGDSEPLESVELRDLRAAGLRLTASRLAVLAAVREVGHLTVEEIAVLSRQRLGAVSTQTVYDVLDALVGAGLVRRIEPAGSPVRFESRRRQPPSPHLPRLRHQWMSAARSGTRRVWRRPAPLITRSRRRNSSIGGICPDCRPDT